MRQVPEFRPIVPHDADELAAVVADAFAAYRAFAHTGWEPPPAADEARRLQSSLAHPDSGGSWHATDGESSVMRRSYRRKAIRFARPRTRLLHTFFT
jgi:hypothetical protein